jgi:TonB family protein
MITPTRVVAIALGIALFQPLRITARAQAAPPRQCSDVLSAPTRDSVLLRVMLTVHAFDRERDLPSSMQFDFGEAVRAHLVLPRPLGADAYEMSGDTSAARTARLPLRGSFAATLTAEGRVVRASTTGGAGNPEFDNAVLTALRAIDSTDHLSFADAGLPKDDVRIRVEIAARDTTAKAGSAMLDRVVISAISSTNAGFPNPGVPPAFAPIPADTAAGIPLFSFRVPVRAVTDALKQIPGIGGLRYPTNRRQPGSSGQVQLSFVVDADGAVEPASMQVVDATQREYADATLDAMAKFRYRPLEIEGCRVRALAEQPFGFFVAK